MLMTTAMKQSVGSGRIRNASLLDLSEISRLLFHASPKRTIAPPHLADRADLFERGYFLVLELAPDRLGAAVHIELDRDERATIDLLAVDSCLPVLETEQRMCGVAHALCEAYGCNDAGTDAHRAPRGRR